MKTLLNISTTTLVNQIKDILLISSGVLMAGIGLKGFILPNQLLDGGVIGSSLLLQIITKIDLSYLIVLVNLPFIYIGAKQISLKFAVKSSLAIFALAVLVHYLQIPSITEDNLLIAFFGGFFLGAGTGLTIRGGAVIDGTEVLAIQISRKSSLSVGDFIALFNVVLFSIALFFIPIEKAMYAMLIYISASKTVDFILNGIEEYIGLMIVSKNYDTLKNHLTHELGKGITILKSSKGFGKTENEDDDNQVIYCVVTRLEVAKLIAEIEKIDPAVFIIQQPVKDAKGGMIKRRPLS